MKTRFYTLVMKGGVELFKEGPYNSPEERLRKTKELARELDGTHLDNVFWMDVDNLGGVYVGSFVNTDGILMKDQL